MYLLDTNICIYLIKNKFPILKQRLLECNPDEVFVSSITVAEMEYGASKSQYREKNRQAMLNFFASFGSILDFTTEDTEAYGIIRAYLENNGNAAALQQLLRRQTKADCVSDLYSGQQLRFDTVRLERVELTQNRQKLDRFRRGDRIDKNRRGAMCCQVFQ